MTADRRTLELRSMVTSAGRTELSLVEATLDPPGPGEVIVRIEASPINPSDQRLLWGPADTSRMEANGDAGRPTLSAPIPEAAMSAVASRIDQSMPVGNEGAGTVIEAGEGVAHLLGKKVGLWGGGMYTRLRKVPARDCVVLPDGVEAAQGASMFINPLTALGFIETMRSGGHHAIVHTAAASNLGQMLNRICIQDGIPLINIVRSEAQAALLRDQGAAIVLDSKTPDFEVRLTDAAAATGATVAFDAIGGGSQTARILAAMEAAAARNLPAYSRYGSDRFKQVYIYGALNPSPTVLDRWVGFAWSVGGWLLMPFLASIGEDAVLRLQQRVKDELTTTFASHYTRTISLADALSPEIARAYSLKATGEKYLIDPSA